MLRMRRLFPYLRKLSRWFGFHHFLMSCLACIIIVTGILLAGSGHSVIAHRIYIVQFRYRNSQIQPIVSSAWQNITDATFEVVNNTDLTARVGYFGLCIAHDGAPWICAGSGANLVRSIQATDPFGLVAMAETVKDEVLFPGFLLGGVGLACVAIILFGSIPQWHEEEDRGGSDVDVKPFPSRPISQCCALSCAIGTIFAFTAALWQHTAAATAATVLQMSAVSVIEASVGSASMALAWLAFVMWMIALVGAVVIVLSIQLLDRLMDD